jgi:hypothetical protein
MSRTPSRSRRIGRPTLILGIAGALLVTTTVAAAATDQTPHRQVLHYNLKFSPQNVIDVPPLQQHQGDYQPGDYAVFSDLITDQHGRTVGTEGGSGLITRVDTTGAQISLTVSIQLPGGQITGQGLGSTDPRKHLAVTGGTGRYVDASGEIDVVEHGDGTGSLTISLD